MGKAPFEMRHVTIGSHPWYQNEMKSDICEKLPRLYSSFCGVVRKRYRSFRALTHHAIYLAFRSAFGRASGKATMGIAHFGAQTGKLLGHGDRPLWDSEWQDSWLWGIAHFGAHAGKLLRYGDLLPWGSD